MSATALTTLPAPIQNAVSLLTSRLMLAPMFSEETIEALSQSLTASLAAVATRPRFNLVLRLNPSAPPPPVIFTACILTGVQWNKWALALTKGKAVETTMEITPAGVSWTGNGITPIVLRSLPLLSIPSLSLGDKMEMMVGNHKFSVVPPTPDAQAVSPASSVSSGASSLFDRTSPTVSSPSTSPAASPASSKCHSRSTSIESISSAKSEGLYVAPRTASHRSHRRTQSIPVVDTSSVALQRFKYQGGETNVVGGGVMLGGSTPKSKPVPLSSKENTPVSAKKGRSRAASRATNWRRAN